MSFKIAGKDAGPIGFGLLSMRLAFHSLIIEVSKKLTLSLGLCRPPAQPYDSAIKVMRAALSHGANVWNGAQHYGTPTTNSLHLLAHYFTQYPADASKVILTIKGCFTAAGPDNSPSGVRTSIDTCLEILDGKVFLDIFEPGRIDPKVPIEETVKVIRDEYILKGKIGGYGISECSASTIRKAHAIYPVGVVEIELSLFSTDVLTNGVWETCQELGIPILAYSPLSRGFLTGRFQSLDDLDANDARRMFPRFAPEVFEENLRLVKEVEKLAEKKGCTVAQVAIAWVKAQENKGGKKGQVIPIPGCTTVQRVEENLTAVLLDERELEELDRMLAEIQIKGERYPEQFKKYQDL